MVLTLIIRFIFALHLLFVALSFNAVSAPLNIHNYQSYSLKQGLSQVAVYDIEEDANGYIWIATQRGVNRFDGHDFINVESFDQQQVGLTGSMVLDIELDITTGDLWFATRTGLDVLRAKTGKYETLPTLMDDLGSVEALTIHIDRNGNIWVGTKTSLYVLNKGAEYITEVPYAAGVLATIDMKMSPQGVLWISTPQGVQRYDTKTTNWLPTILQTTLPSQLFFDRHENLWVATNGNGVFLLRPVQPSENMAQEYSIAKHISMENGLVSNIVQDIQEAENGDIWLATTDGISIVSASDHTAKSMPKLSLTTLTSLDKNTYVGNALSLFHHSDGFVFVGTLTNGFYVLNANKTMFTNASIDDGKIPYSVTIDANDNAWIPTDSGVYKMDKQHKVHGPYTEKTNLNTQTVSNILQDAYYSTRHNELYLGSRIGLRKLNKESLSVEKMAFQTALVYSISPEENGHLYLSTRHSGLFLYDPINQNIINHWTIPLSFEVVAIDDTHILVPSTNGLYLINKNTDIVKVYRHKGDVSNSLPYNVVTWVSKRKNGEYFVGTQGKGLHLMRYSSIDDTPTFTPLFPNTDLGRLSIGAVIKGAYGDYWITTTEGIVQLTEDLSQVTFFGKSDGVNASGYFIGSADVNSNGRIYFAGVGNMTHFHPSEITHQKSFPRLQLTNISMLNDDQRKLIQQPLKTTHIINQQKLTLPPNNLVVSFDFAALEFGSADKIEYAYMLEGFHQDWQYTDSRARNATFTNLAAGDYVFKVKSTNRYQTWNDDVLSLNIKVLSPWWRTKLAVVIWLCLLAISILLIYKWRTYALHQREQVLTALVKEKTLDLEALNTQLKQLSMRDPLTSMLNRRGFKECAQAEIARCARNQFACSIVLFDVDNFKLLNDQYGHDFGDSVLVNMSQVINENVRKGDIVARWGGEEFIILLPNTALAEAKSFAETLNACVSQTQTISGVSISTSFSAGVVEMQTNSSLDDCIGRADLLLYRAKQAGRNQVCVDAVN
ncbi:MAG: diguanylate cyclase [Glaciecola sp.]